MTTNGIYTTEMAGDGPFFLFCDHAGNHFPEEYHCLGIPDDILQTHIAWDPGAGPLTRALTQRLSGRAVLCSFSRLLIDPNRPTDRHDLIVTSSDQIPIPGNQNLTAEQRDTRIRELFEPYHQRLESELEDFDRRGIAPFVLSVHSFAPRLMGRIEERPWHLGALWSHDAPTARKFMALIRERTDYEIGDNEPYNAQEFNYSVDIHVAPRNLRHITMEVRQDLIETEDQVEQLADQLAPIFRELQEGET